MRPAQSIDRHARKRAAATEDIGVDLGNLTDSTIPFPPVPVPVEEAYGYGRDQLLQYAASR